MSISRCQWLCALTVFVYAAAAAEPQYVGSSACRVCHPANYGSQSTTGHAHALTKASIGARGEWQFGAGEKAVTWVSQVNRDTYAEHGLSYFSATKRLGLTPGHTDSKDALYRTFDPEATTLRCFRCHSTGPLQLSANDRIEPSEPGVHCESCHGPGSEHIQSLGKGTILNPKRLSRMALNDLCGACHRNAPENDWTDKWKTRHQPSYLTQAACFRKSGTLSCVTCHSPHQPLQQTAASYDKQCTDCHQKAKHQTAIGTRSCVGCHMPQVVIGPQISFTNHWIGIYSWENALVPRRSAMIAPLAAVDHPPFLPADPATLRPLFERALNESKIEFGVQNIRTARSAADLGRFLLKEGYPSDAEPVLREAVSIHDTLGSPESGSDRESLAQTLSSLGRTDEAFAFFQAASAASDPKTSAEAFASLAVLDPGHSEQYYRKAVEAEEQVSPSDPKHLAILLNDLAMAVQEKHDYTQAEALFRKALALQRREIGSDSPASGATLSNLGSLLETMARHNEAEKAEREAIRIFEVKLGPWSAELATSYANLADVLASKGDSANATILYRRAVAVDESVYGPEHPEVAGDLVNLGTLLRSTGQKDAGNQALRRALTIYEKAFGPASQQAAQVRANLQ